MSDSDLDENYPGVGRLHFFLGKVGLIAASIASVIWFGPDSSITRIVGLAILVASFVLDVMRLRNIGVSQWFAMLRFIPYVNLLYMIGLQSAQAGWIETRRLDRTGITLALFQLGLVILMFLLFLRLHIAVPLIF